MLSNEYLYGKDVEVPVISEYVVMRRVELLKDHLSEMLDVPYQERTYEDQIQIGEILKGIDFWDKMQKENC